MIALAYAAQNGRDVAGLVLVDASPRAALGKLQNTLQPAQWRGFAKLIADAKEGWDAESLLASEAWLQSRQLKLRIPVIVISRGLPQQPPPAAVWPAELGNPWNEIESAWEEGQRDLLRVSHESQRIIAVKSRHHIHRSEPDIIVGAIFRVLDLVRLRN